MNRHSKLFLITLCFIVTWPAITVGQTNGQTQKPTTPSSVVIVGVMKGEGLFRSYFESPYTNEKLEKNISVFAETRHPNWFLFSNGQFTQDPFNKKRLSFQAHNHTFSAGPIRANVGFSYSYSEARERLLQTGTLELIDLSKKHFGVASIGVGLGTYDKSHLRFLFLAGGAHTRYDLNIYVDNRLSNPNNHNFGNDTLPMVGEEILIYLKPFKTLVLEAAGKYLKTLSNRQGIIPLENWLLESRVTFFVYRNIGISAHGTYTDNPHGMAFTSQSAEIGLAIKIKPHH